MCGGGWLLFDRSKSPNQLPSMRFVKYQKNEAQSQDEYAYDNTTFTKLIAILLCFVQNICIYADVHIGKRETWVLNYYCFSRRFPSFWSHPFLVCIIHLSSLLFNVFMPLTKQSINEIRPTHKKNQTNKPKHKQKQQIKNRLLYLDGAIKFKVNHAF